MYICVCMLHCRYTQYPVYARIMINCLILLLPCYSPDAMVIHLVISSHHLCSFFFVLPCALLFEVHINIFYIF